MVLEVNITLDDISVTVNEDVGVVNLCASATGFMADNVTAFVTYQDGTAQSKCIFDDAKQWNT